MNTQQLTERPSTSRRPSRRVLISGAVAASLALGGATAFAANATTLTGHRQEKSGPDHEGPREGFGLGLPLHGELVVAKAGGGTQTIVTQAGAVTAISANSVSIKSSDGFARTYVITGKTLTGPPGATAPGLKVGDEVHIAALKSGASLTALQLGSGRAHGPMERPGSPDANEPGGPQEPPRPGGPGPAPTENRG